eukprot:14328770-Ditylum_brightwellii.AAC.1
MELKSHEFCEPEQHRKEQHHKNHQADGSSTPEARCGNKAVRAFVWQEVRKWCEMHAAAKETCMW